MILGQFWCPFSIVFTTFWRSGAAVKTLLPPVRESHSRILSVYKKVFFDSTLSIPTFGKPSGRLWNDFGVQVGVQGGPFGDHGAFFSAPIF